MNFVTAYCTDVGIRKKTNQDSMLIMQADTDAGKVLFAAVCDGMGGLAKGEVASAKAIHSLSEWFRNAFPPILFGGLQEQTLFESLNHMIQDANNEISGYGARIGMDLGTTITALLIVGSKYYVVNVGDSRVYRIEHTLEQITHDQTVVQREVDHGRLTPEQAMTDPRRSILLQCVGASDKVVPDFYSGAVSGRENFLICCDGFRHVISPEELYEGLNPAVAVTREQMTANLQYFVDTNKYRQETDNISAVLVHLC